MIVLASLSGAYQVAEIRYTSRKCDRPTQSCTVDSASLNAAWPVPHCTHTPTVPLQTPIGIVGSDNANSSALVSLVGKTVGIGQTDMEAVRWTRIISYIPLLRVVPIFLIAKELKNLAITHSRLSRFDMATEPAIA